MPVDPNAADRKRQGKVGGVFGAFARAFTSADLGGKESGEVKAVGLVHAETAAEAGGDPKG
jgi:hypothetical protein